MNCQPHDRAVVVRARHHDRCTRSMLGTFITVRTPVLTDEGWHWEFEPGPLVCRNCGGLRYEFRDADLQPIRGLDPANSTVHKSERRVTELA